MHVSTAATIAIDQALEAFTDDVLALSVPALSTVSCSGPRVRE
jgi:hypothetical protein